MAKGTTVQEHLIGKLGVHKGALATAWLVQWGLAQAELGHFPSVREYGEYWAVSQRTVFRHRAMIRKALSEDDFQRLSGELAAVAAKVGRSPGKLRRALVTA